jgi:hypothetical protein
MSTGSARDLAPDRAPVRPGGTDGEMPRATVAMTGGLGSFDRHGALSMSALRRPTAPRTAVLRRVLLARPLGRDTVDDPLFLEAWESRPSADIAALLRVRQLRRAHPALADAITEELARARRSPPTGGAGLLPPGGTGGRSGPWPGGDRRACPPGAGHPPVLPAPPSVGRPGAAGAGR